MNVKKLVVLAFAGVIATFSTADARPSPDAARAVMPFEPAAPAQVAAKAAADTFWFGGTHWDAAQARWEANVSTSRTNRWTFDSGVDGNMEGWWGYDNTVIPPPTCPRAPAGTPDNADFRWTHDHLYSLYGTPGTDLFPDSTPPDTGAIWCAKYEVEADELCYGRGQGYGNRWHHEARKTYGYGGAGDARITFKYFNTSEKNFDFTYLYLEFNGVREAGPRVTMTYTLGTPISKRTKTLTVSAASIPAGTIQITAVFRFTADSGWSDEDSQTPTVYGPFCCYDFKYEDLGTPANADEDTFEESPEGWTFYQPAGVGTFVSVRNLADLPPPETACPCAGAVLHGNVLTQCNEQGQHSEGQDDFAMSPLIDLDAAGLGAAPVKMVFGDGYMDLPLNNAIHYKIWLRQYPVLCEATGDYIEEFVAENYSTYVPGPTCYDDVIWDDFSRTSPDIDYCYIALEVIELCATSTECTQPGGNSSPWWDNMAFIVTGTPGAPPVSSTDRRPFLQDIFAYDGSLRPRSTCNLDNSGDKNFGTSASDADLEDTMYVSCGGVGVEVDLWFRFKGGPGTGTTDAFFARYPQQGTWYSARCDTARLFASSGEFQGTWCSEYHEASPYFAGENAESNEILPDRVFTPGTHIEYYWSANYLATPSSKFFWPDVPSGDQPLSVDLLPGMWVTTPGDTIWPCTLYLNGESRQPLKATSPYHQIEPALSLALGVAPGTPHAFDRYDDVLAGSNTNASFARQASGDNGMTDLQVLGYQSIIGVYGTTQNYTVSNEDGQLLAFWLSTTIGAGNNSRQLLYFSGDGLAVDMSNALKPDATDLLNNYFGAILSCSPYREAGCPGGAVADTSFCVQLSPAAGAEASFAFSGSPYRAQGNGCPTNRRFSVLGVNAGVPTAKPNLDYVDQDGPKGATHYASITNDRAGVSNGDYRTVFDGMGLSRFRRPAGAGWDCTRDSLAILDRLRDVMTWAYAPLTPPLDCPLFHHVADATNDDRALPKVNSLTVSPNPFNPLVRMTYALAAPGRVTLRIFDVQGALIKTLVDEAKVAGRYEALWNGTDDGGRKLSSGVFWARYEAPGSGIVKQLVLLK